MIETHELDGGATLITETNSAMRSLAMQIVVPVGTSRDPEDLVGLAPMCAEFLLRGAGSLDSRAHADALDALGVNRSTNAGTHFIRVGATMLGTRFDDALDLVVDMVRRPRFDPDAIEPVRALAIQAIESIEDDPHERAVLAARDRHHPAPFNRPQSGTLEGVRRATRDDIVQHWEANARPRGAIVTLAGAVPGHAFDRIRAAFEGWDGAPNDLAPLGTPTRGYAHLEDDSNQTQIIVVREAPAEPDPSSMLERVATSVLSGGMSGRLFTEVREKKGLCYDVHASYQADRDRGWITGYVGSQPDTAQDALDTLLAELRRIRTGDGAITAEEFDRAIIGWKSRLVFSGESTGARAAALASDQFRLGRARSLDEIAAAIDAITREQVQDHLSSAPEGAFTIQTLGPRPLSVTL